MKNNSIYKNESKNANRDIEQAFQQSINKYQQEAQQRSWVKDFVWPPFDEIQLLVLFSLVTLGIIFNWEYWTDWVMEEGDVIEGFYFLVMYGFLAFIVIRNAFSYREMATFEKNVVINFFYMVLSGLSVLSVFEVLLRSEVIQSGWEYVNFAALVYTALTSLLTLFSTYLIHDAKMVHTLHSQIRPKQALPIFAILAVVACLIVFVAVFPFYDGITAVVIAYFYVTKGVGLVESLLNSMAG